MNNEQFYQHVAGLLNTTYECSGRQFPKQRRGRWNNRHPGHGRYPGFGLVRVFGDTIHIALKSPVAINAVVVGREAALEFLTIQLRDI